MTGMTVQGALTHKGIRTWVDEVAAMTRPDRILVCDGSETEKDTLIQESLASGELMTAVFYFVGDRYSAGLDVNQPSNCNQAF